MMELVKERTNKNTFAILRQRLTSFEIPCRKKSMTITPRNMYAAGIRWKLTAALLLFTMGLAIAQYNGVQHWHAYYTVQYKGTIPVDEHGNPTDDGIDTAYTILAEVLPADTAQLQFSKVFLREHWWSISVRTITQKPLTIGYDREQNKAITVAPAGGALFLQLYLTLLPGHKETAVSPKDGLLVTGKWKGQKRQWTINSLKALPAIYYP